MHILTWYIEHHPLVEEQWNSSGISNQSGVSAILSNSSRVKMKTDNSSLIVWILQCLYYYMRNFCNLIGLEQWYFSLI